MSSIDEFKDQADSGSDAGSEDSSDELRRLRTRHQLILDSAGEGVYGLDAEGCTTFVNETATHILGWRPEDVIGLPLHDIHHHSYADGSPHPREDCPIYSAIRDGQVHQMDCEVFWRTDGSSVPVEYTSTPIREDGEITGAVVVFRDISARMEIERQREEAWQEIVQLKEQLEQERDYLRNEINVNANFGEIIGNSQALKHTLSQHFLNLSCSDLGRKALRLTLNHIDCLMRHDWPGNIRELKNVLERAVILSSGQQLRLDLATDDAYLTEPELREREKANMVAVLEVAAWRISGPGGAAELLGVKPSTLAYRMKPRRKK